MHHLTLMKLGFSVLAAVSGNAGASPTELAVALVKQIATKSTKTAPVDFRHCGVCHSGVAA